MTNIIKYESGMLAKNQEFAADDLIEQFLLETQEVMKSTKDRYRKSLKKYFNWVEENGLHVKSVTLPDILRYKQYLKDVVLEDKTNLSEITIGTYLSVVRSFYAWANSRGFPFNPAATLKSPKKEMKYGKKPISPEDMNKLFEHFKGRSKRDYAIATTLYYCALRCMELCRLNFSDIKIENVPDHPGGVRVIWVQGKGKKKKDNWVPIRDEAYQNILEYAQERGVPPTGDVAIFVSEDPINAGSRLIPGSVSRIIKNGLRAIGLDSRQYTAHSLRHSAGTNLIDAGASIQEVQRFHRHSNSQTTEGYATEALERKRLKENISKLL